MTYTWSGLTAFPAMASDTAIVVFFARISASSSTPSSPPAEAPNSHNEAGRLAARF